MKKSTAIKILNRRKEWLESKHTVVNDRESHFVLAEISALTLAIATLKCDSIHDIVDMYKPQREQ